MTLWLFSLQSKICIANQIYSNSFRQVFKYKSIYYPTSNQQHPFTLCSMTRLHSYFSIWWHLTRIKMLLDKSSPRKSPAIPSTKSNPFALPRVTARAGQSILQSSSQPSRSHEFCIVSAGIKYTTRARFSQYSHFCLHISIHPLIRTIFIMNPRMNEWMTGVLGVKQYNSTEQRMLCRFIGESFPLFVVVVVIVISVGGWMCYCWQGY